jgi:hypothetical protein
MCCCHHHPNVVEDYSLHRLHHTVTTLAFETLALLCRHHEQDADVPPLEQQIEEEGNQHTPPFSIMKDTPLFPSLAARADTSSFVVVATYPMLAWYDKPATFDSLRRHKAWPKDGVDDIIVAVLS